MSQTFTLFINLLSYNDTVPTNSPSLSTFNWARRLSDIPTDKSGSKQHVVSVNQVESILSLQRSLTTGASWTVSNTVGVTARWTWSGVNPTLRTERVGSALTTSSTINVVRQGNSKVVKLTFSGSPGTGIVSGDTLYLGSNSGVNALNEGMFSVVSAGGTWIEVLGPDMVNESGVVVVDPTDIYAFSAGPVRVGDSLLVNNVAFNFGNREESQITAVTSRWLEVQNSNVVPEGPITADIVVYDQLYKLTYLESDQPVNVYINSSAQAMQIEPIQEGQGGLVGFLLWRGPVYSVSIENLGYEPANITSFFAT